MTEIIKMLDGHIALAEELGLTIDYIAMPTNVITNLSDEILSMIPTEVELGSVKTYRGISIRAVEGLNVKICYALNGVFCV